MNTPAIKNFKKSPFNIDLYGYFYKPQSSGLYRDQVVCIWLFWMSDTPQLAAGFFILVQSVDLASLEFVLFFAGC